MYLKLKMLLERVKVDVFPRESDLNAIIFVDYCFLFFLSTIDQPV